MLLGDSIVSYSLQFKFTSGTDEGAKSWANEKITYLTDYVEQTCNGEVGPVIDSITTNTPRSTKRFAEVRFSDSLGLITEFVSRDERNQPYASVKLVVYSKEYISSTIVPRIDWYVDAINQSITKGETDPALKKTSDPIMIKLTPPYGWSDGPDGFCLEFQSILSRGLVLSLAEMLKPYDGESEGSPSSKFPLMIRTSWKPQANIKLIVDGFEVSYTISNGSDVEDNSQNRVNASDDDLSLDELRKRIGFWVEFDVIQKLAADHFPELAPLGGEINEISVPDPSGLYPPVRAILVTRETSFKTTGRAEMWMTTSKEIVVTLKSGFEAKRMVYVESPKKWVDAYYDRIKADEKENKKSGTNRPKSTKNNQGATGKSNPIKPMPQENSYKIDSVLPALSSIKSASIDEARECVRLLDEHLKQDPGNTRIQKVRSTITDIFREEALLMQARSNYQKAEKLLATEKRNLEITSKPSSLTGRVNQNEVARTRGKVNAAQAAMQSEKSKSEKSRSSLQKLLNDALSGLPEEEREALAPVWQQVAKRHQIKLRK